MDVGGRAEGTILTFVWINYEESVARSQFQDLNKLCYR